MWLRPQSADPDPDRLQPTAERDRPGPGLRRLRHGSCTTFDLPARTGYHIVTGVREHDGRVWLGSLHEPAIAVVSL